MGIKDRSFPDKHKDDVPGVSLKDIDANAIQDNATKAVIKDILKFLKGKYK